MEVQNDNGDGVSMTSLEISKRSDRDENRSRLRIRYVDYENKGFQ